jgi:hypothetical protein
MEDQHVLKLVQSTLVELGLADLKMLWEAPLVSDGHYFGRRYEFDGLSAFWFRSQGKLEMYDSEWRLLTEVTVEPGTLAKEAA